jgi:hypothetical protein
MSEAGLNYSAGLFVIGVLIAFVGCFIIDFSRRTRLASVLYITAGLCALPLLVRLILGAVLL